MPKMLPNQHTHSHTIQKWTQKGKRLAFSLSSSFFSFEIVQGTADLLLEACDHFREKRVALCEDKNLLLRNGALNIIVFNQDIFAKNLQAKKRRGKEGGWGGGRRPRVGGACIQKFPSVARWETLRVKVEAKRLNRKEIQQERGWMVIGQRERKTNLDGNNLL